MLKSCFYCGTGCEGMNKGGPGTGSESGDEGKWMPKSFSGFGTSDGNRDEGKRMPKSSNGFSTGDDNGDKGKQMPKFFSSNTDDNDGDEGKWMPKSFNGSHTGCEGMVRDSLGAGSKDEGKQMPKSSNCAVDGVCTQNYFQDLCSIMYAYRIDPPQTLGKVMHIS